jgi:hypothetical protein
MSWHIALRNAAGAALLVLVGSSAAHASDFFELDVPNALPAASPLASSIARDVARTAYFGTEPADSGAAAYASQGEAALYVWWAIGEPANAPAEAIRAAFDRLQRAPAEASPQARSVAIDAWDEAIVGGIAHADFAWRHLSNETLNLTRALAFAGSDQRPRLVVAECVMPTRREGEVKPTCTAALASLTITTPEAERVALDALPEGEPPAELAATVPQLATGSDQGEPSGASVSSTADQPRLDAPHEGVLYERRDERGGRGDGPPWLLILGALLVAAAVYATVRSRASNLDDRRREPQGERAPEENDGAEDEDDEGHGAEDGAAASDEDDDAPKHAAADEGPDDEDEGAKT